MPRKIPIKNNPAEKSKKVKEKNENLVERLPVENIDLFKYEMVENPEQIFEQLKNILNDMKILSLGDEYLLRILSNNLHLCNRLYSELLLEGFLRSDGSFNPKYAAYMRLASYITGALNSMGLSIKSRSTLYSANVIKIDNTDSVFKKFFEE